jgi:hypothetical protein
MYLSGYEYRLVRDQILHKIVQQYFTNLRIELHINTFKSFKKDYCMYLCAHLLNTLSRCLTFKQICKIYVIIL